MSDCTEAQTPQDKYRETMKAARLVYQERVAPILTEIAEQSNGFYEMVNQKFKSGTWTILVRSSDEPNDDGNYTPFVYPIPFMEKHGLYEEWHGRIRFEIDMGYIDGSHTVRKFTEMKAGKKVGIGLRPKQVEQLTLCLLQYAEKHRDRVEREEAASKAREAVLERGRVLDDALIPLGGTCSIQQWCEDGDEHEEIRVRFDFVLRSDEETLALAKIIAAHIPIETRPDEDTVRAVLHKRYGTGGYSWQRASHKVVVNGQEYNT